MNIQIPDPCPENWDSMIPGEKGRFCNTCCKTVVDFSAMSPEAISSYLIQHRSEKIRGRFHKSQLKETLPSALTLIKKVYQSGLHHVQKMAALFFLIFAFSQQSSAQTNPATDSVKTKTMILGRIVCPSKKPEPEKKTKKAAPKQSSEKRQLPASTSGEQIDPAYTMGLVAPAERRE